MAVDGLRTLSRPVRTPKEKAQVATISAHNDEVVGQLVADAMEAMIQDIAVLTGAQVISEAGIPLLTDAIMTEIPEPRAGGGLAPAEEAF